MPQKKSQTPTQIYTVTNNNTQMQNAVHMLNKVNCTSPPLVAPPRQVALRLPVGQTALAARTHCSHRFLVRAIVFPAPMALSVNSALPTRPWVMLGEPSQRCCAEPAMPPQMESSAAFWSWKTMWLWCC